MRYLLSAATIALSAGFGVGSANAQNLRDAVNEALSDGCQGFLTPTEFSVTQDIERVGAEIIDAAGRRVFEVEPPDFDTNGNAIFDPPPALFDPPTLYEQNWAENQLIPQFDAEGLLIGYNLEFLGDQIFEVANGGTLPGGGTTKTLNFFRVETDVSQQADVSEIRAPNAGLLGGGLAEYCTVNGLAERQTLTRTVISHFFFNADVGTKFGVGSAGAFGSANAITAFGVASAAGAGANRAQEGVLRRERGLFSLIERLRRRAQEWREAGVQVASLDDTYVPTGRGFAVVVDLSGGFVNTERDATDLEGAFSADSTLFNAGAAVALRNNVMFGGALTFENTDSDVTASPDGRTSFENEAMTASAFAGWATPAPIMSEEGRLILTGAFSYNSGDQSYERGFSATFQPDLDDPDETTNTDQLNGSTDQDVTTFTLQATLSQPLGALTFTPHVSFSYVRFEAGAYAEAIDGTDGEDNGLALRYDDVEDEWTETRLGAGLAYAAPEGGWELSANADAVFVGDAETPLRTAYFVQDLRAAPFAITYQVDSLDDQYFDLSGSIGYQFANGVTPYVSAFTRAGHEYIDSHGAFAGLRLAF